MTTRIRALLALLVLVSLFMTPALASATETDGAPFDVKFSGVIETAPAASGAPWVVAGQTVKTNGSTKIRMATEEKAAAGMWADVTARKLSDGTWLALKLTVMAPEMRLRGPLQALAEGDLGTWTVAGIDFTVNEDTKISDRGEPIMLDDWVEVRAVQEGAELVAVSILSLTEEEDVEIFGAIQAFSETEWTVSGVTIASNTDTKVMGKPAAGLLAHMAATLEEDGTLLAQTVKVVWNQPGGWRQQQNITGEIEAMPEDGLVGVWTVAGKQVEVSEQTRIMQRRGLAEVGATVHVVGFTEDDVVKALLVVVMAPAEGAETFQLIGTIETLPTGGTTGEWVVSGKTVLVTEWTRIAGLQFVKVGAPVTVLGIEKTGGALVATLAHAKEIR